jgi:DAACS family dicarboxylate/amino acid:cation (Na+ or H+) symporter
MYEVVMKIIGFAMKLAPFGIMALLFVLTVNMGWSILSVLLKYVLLVLGALAFHQFVTYSIILRYFAGRNPGRFFGQVKDVMLTAFSTSSSNATLPTAIDASINKLGISKDVTNFTLTIGSTGNQHGTALYEGITILFLAQCFGVELSTGSQIMVVFISILAGMGTAGVPGGSLPVMMLILVSIGVPGESIALIYGVDRILDMSRTVLNVTGDLTAAAYIQYSEDKREARRELKIKD